MGCNGKGDLGKENQINHSFVNAIHIDLIDSKHVYVIYIYIYIHENKMLQVTLVYARPAFTKPFWGDFAPCIATI